MVDESIKSTEEKNVILDDIQDIQVPETVKKKFRINGDYNRILELDVSDLTIVNRIRDTYPKLESLANEAKEKISAIDEDNIIIGMSDTLRDIDTRMRNLIDELFGANVSKVMAPTGCMFDPCNGEYRFQHILRITLDLYGNGLAGEFNKIKDNVEKHTKKYTKKKNRNV